MHTMAEPTQRWAVFEQPQGGLHAVAIRAFDWAAFGAGGVWALTHRMWLRGGVLLALDALVLMGLYHSFATPSVQEGVYRMKFTQLVEPAAFLLPLFPALALRFIMGLHAGRMRIQQFKRRGHVLLGSVESATDVQAAARVGSGALKPVHDSLATDLVPESLKPVAAIIWLTWKAAQRYRLLWVLSGVLLCSVGLLPFLLQDDGTAKGLVHILITYTMYMIILVLGTATIWLSCGTLANEVEECQMQLVDAKPVSRATVWLGKWLGVMSLNLVMLALAGSAVYTLVHYRVAHLWDRRYEELRHESDTNIVRMATREGILTNTPTGQLPPVLPEHVAELREDLANLEVIRAKWDLLTSRTSIKPDFEDLERLIRDGKFSDGRWAPLWTKTDQMIKRELAARMPEIFGGRPLAEFDLVRFAQSPEAFKAGYDLEKERTRTFEEQKQVMEAVAPQGGTHEWRFKLPELKAWMGARASKAPQIRLRFKLEAFVKTTEKDARETANIMMQDKVFDCGLVLGDMKNPEKMIVRRPLTVRTFHEFPVTPDMLDEDGTLVFTFINGDGQVPLALPFWNGSMEVLYQEGGFLGNFMRAQMLIFCWLGILAAVGLACASFMAFPMASFTCIGLLIIALATPMMQQVVSDGGISQTYDMKIGKRNKSVVDYFAIPAFWLLTKITEPLTKDSPVTSLSEGRSISWGDLLKAYALLWGVGGGAFVLGGIVVYHHRELALAGKA